MLKFCEYFSVQSPNASPSKPQTEGSAAQLECYAPYVRRVLRQVHGEDACLSRQGAAAVDVILNNVFGRIATEAARLAQSEILSPLFVEAAVVALFGAELGRHAVAEGAKAVAMYQTNSA